jgi:hypothetical protein
MVQSVQPIAVESQTCIALFYHEPDQWSGISGW